MHIYPANVKSYIYSTDFFSLISKWTNYTYYYTILSSSKDYTMLHLTKLCYTNFIVFQIFGNTDMHIDINILVKCIDQHHDYNIHHTDQVGTIPPLN